jgi:hypothetical protein
MLVLLIELCTGLFICFILRSLVLSDTIMRRKLIRREGCSRREKCSGYQTVDFPRFSVERKHHRTRAGNPVTCQSLRFCISLIEEIRLPSESLSQGFRARGLTKVRWMFSHGSRNCFIYKLIRDNRLSLADWVDSFEGAEPSATHANQR